MQNRLALQYYCLEIMGITRWALQSTPKREVYRYLVLIDSKETVLSAQKQALLTRMLQALRWPSEAVKVQMTEDQAIHHYIEQYQPQKMLLFKSEIESRDIPVTISVAQLPSLEALLTSPAAKKQAWQAMQSLIEK